MSTTEPTTAEADAAAEYTGPTRSIPFHFHISSDPPHQLTYEHPVPTPLLVPEPSESDSDLFVSTLSSALVAHRDECKAAAAPVCEICGADSDSVIQTPVSFLHVAEPADDEDDAVFNADLPKAERERRSSALRKRVDVLVTPVCGKETCALLARQKVRRVVEGMQEEQEGWEIGIKEGPEDPRCATCGKTGDTKKCTGCERVRYCGRECQKKDWKKHRRVCGVL